MTYAETRMQIDQYIAVGATHIALAVEGEQAWFTIAEIEQLWADLAPGDPFEVTGFKSESEQPVTEPDPITEWVAKMRIGQVWQAIDCAPESAKGSPMLVALQARIARWVDFGPGDLVRWADPAARQDVYGIVIRVDSAHDVVTVMFVGSKKTSTVSRHVLMRVNPISSKS
ncbi:hypothetical protein [Pseudomonas sp.]|uniref:hypothetical protein n=1 Tax=Pseudomonas sp. TaxID=306 RepID=UPI00260CF5E0|nr:hypothetical protein [Pseudomonas sp.]